MDPFVKSAFSAVDLLSGGSANDEELAALQEKVSKDEDDLQSNLDLANAYLAKGRHEEAIDLLLKSIRKDKYWKESAARELLMKTIDSLGPNNALASQRYAMRHPCLFLWSVGRWIEWADGGRNG